LIKYLWKRGVLNVEEILKEILNKINNLERKTDTGFASINERIEMLHRGSSEEFRQLNKKIDGITDVVAKTMEDITELKAKVEKQDVEIRVIKGGAANA
jgi:predicted  nucleic acid-binding Zn-ribbon protein